MSICISRDVRILDSSRLGVIVMSSVGASKDLLFLAPRDSP